MQVKSIKECSKGSILQFFQPSLSYHLSFKFLFCLFLSGPFTQVLLYYICLRLSLLAVTFFLQITFANSLDPDQDQQNVSLDLNSKLVTLLTVFLKENFEKFDFEKSEDDN